MRNLDSKFVEIQNLVNSLTFTSFPIGEDIEKARKSLKNQTTSLTDFNDSFNEYCSGVKTLESNICSVLGKIYGITEGMSKFKGVYVISEGGQVDKNKVMQLMLKNPADLMKEEKEILEYVKIVLGEDEYIKSKAVEQGLIPKIQMKPGTRYADFQRVGVVQRTEPLPENLWKAKDREQFDYLDNLIEGRSPGHCAYRSGGR